VQIRASLLEPAGLVEILQRAVQIALGAARNAPVVEGVGMVRLEPEGLCVVLQRAVQVAESRAYPGALCRYASLDSTRSNQENAMRPKKGPALILLRSNPMPTMS
jgi:hypothetical protein